MSVVHRNRYDDRNKAIILVSSVLTAALVELNNTGDTAVFTILNAVWLGNALPYALVVELNVRMFVVYCRLDCVLVRGQASRITGQKKKGNF